MEKAHTPAAAVTFLSCYAGYRLSTLCQQRGRRTFPWNAGRLQRKIDAVLNALELSDYRERHPASLSGGQKQRVTIGVAIVKDSPVIYFDEPTSGLDYDSMVRVSKLIEQLSDSGVIVFVVSHDFEFIVRTCTEVVQLDDDGTIQNQQLSPTVLKSLSEKYFT